MFALNHGWSGSAADQAVSITLTAVAVSIVLHGVSVTPLMARYARRQVRKSERAPSNDRRNEIR